MLPDMHTAKIIGKARQDDWLREAERHQLLHTTRATRSGNRQFRLWRRNDNHLTPSPELSRTPTREPAI
jgi:hypothetical protein